MKNTIKVSLAIIGTIIGAGFASGQEILAFFSIYGIKGVLGIFIASIILGVLIYKIFNILNSNKINNYDDFLDRIIKNKKINKIIKAIINLFLIISFYIMIAGFCAYFKQEFKINIFISAFVITFLCIITFNKNINGVIFINSILMPVLILFIFFIGIKNINFMVSYFLQESNFLSENFISIKWLISSILYASYNSILLIPILINLKPYIKTKPQAKKVSIFCFIILLILGICIHFLLLRGRGYILELDLPIIQIIKEFGKYYPYIYGLVIISAIFSSAISAGYGFLSNATKDEKKYKKYAILLCISAIFISPIGFSKLVGIWYPFFGVLGLTQIIYILLN